MIKSFDNFIDLLYGIRLDRLLTVAEGGIGHPDLVRDAHRHVTHIEGDLRDMLVVIDLTVQVGFFHILQLVAVFILHQQVIVLIKVNHASGSFRLFERA